MIIKLKFLYQNNITHMLIAWSQNDMKRFYDKINFLQNNIINLKI